MKNIIKKLCRKGKSTKGFTMIEMIITVAVTAIFFAGVVAILPSVLKSYHAVISMNAARQIAESVSNAISEQITYASGVEVKSEGVLEYIYYVKGIKGADGTADQDPRNERRKIELKDDIEKIPGMVYDKAYFRDNKVNLKNASITGNVCTLTVEVVPDQGASKIEKTISIRLYGKN